MFMRRQYLVDMADRVDKDRLRRAVQDPTSDDSGNKERV